MTLNTVTVTNAKNFNTRIATLNRIVKEIDKKIIENILSLGISRRLLQLSVYNSRRLPKLTFGNPNVSFGSLLELQNENCGSLLQMPNDSFGSLLELLNATKSNKKVFHDLIFDNRNL